LTNNCQEAKIYVLIYGRGPTVMLLPRGLWLS